MTPEKIEQAITAARIKFDNEIEDHVIALADDCVDAFLIASGSEAGYQSGDPKYDEYHERDEARLVLEEYAAKWHSDAVECERRSRLLHGYKAKAADLVMALNAFEGTGIPASAAQAAFAFLRKIRDEGDV
jgi:hypothetical protein